MSKPDFSENKIYLGNVIITKVPGVRYGKWEMICMSAAFQSHRGQ